MVARGCENPSRHFLLSLLLHAGSPGVSPGCLQGEGRAAPWTSRRFIAAPHRKASNHSHSHTWESLGFQFASCACFWRVGGSRSTQTEYMRNSTRRASAGGQTCDFCSCHCTTVSPQRLQSTLNLRRKGQMSDSFSDKFSSGITVYLNF